MATIEIARLVPAPLSDAAVRRIVRLVIASAAKQSRRPTTTRLPRRSLTLAPRNDEAVSIAFVGPREIRRLNRTYHSEDRVTDVLAFGGAEREETRNSKPETRNKSKTRNSKFGHSHLFRISDFGFRISGATLPPEEARSIGEIVVCPSAVRSQARRAGEPFTRELTRVLIHGTLHLLGYDHTTARQAEEMFRLQEAAVERFTGRDAPPGNSKHEIRNSKQIRMTE